MINELFETFGFAKEQPETADL